MSRLYSEYADWWPLFADPAYYASEAASVTAILTETLGHSPRYVLELGCGGGSMASHLKTSMALTLVDLEPRMLAESRVLNPDCRHVPGDMRTVRLNQRFDAVILHDAVNYMTSTADLECALRTASAHLLPGGQALVLPDDTCESFQPTTATGGRDGVDGRSLRYLLWTSPPVEATYAVDFAIMLRDSTGVFEVLHERHRFGLFSRDAWVSAFRSAGLAPPRIWQDGLRDHVFCAGRSPA